jgi:hypothetical protein
MLGNCQILASYISDMKRDLKAANDLLDIFKYIRKGTVVYAERLHIGASRSGVGFWFDSYEPAILRYKDWVYKEKGIAMMFDVLASQDSVAYSSPYQPEYSGKLARIRCPKYYDAKKIKIVPISDLPLYVTYRHKTVLFEKLLKGVK